MSDFKDDNDRLRAGALPDDPEDDAVEVRPEDPPREVDLDELCKIDHSDLGNAKRLDARFGEDIRWTDTRKQWLLWRGAHWDWDERRTVHRLSQRTIELLKDETKHLESRLKALGPQASDEDDETAKRRKILDAMVKSSRKHALQSQGTTRIAAASAEVRGLANRTIAIADLDSDATLLNTLSGTIDLTSRKCRPHRREDYITRACPVHYDPDADCPLWRGFIDGIFPDKAVRPFVKRAIGLTLTGDVSYQVWFLMKGGGSNGKSTLIDILHALLGPYAFSVPEGALEEQKFQQHPTELVGFQGARFAAASEPRKGKKWDAERVKRLTGGDPISARGMGENMYSFPPTHKLWVACNEVPSTDDSSNGFWRRVIIIPFDVQFRRPDEPDDGRPKADLDLPHRMKGELPGILNWAIEGLADLRENGLQVPDACVKATKEYRKEQDKVAMFLDAECERGAEQGATAHADLYKAFRRWFEATGQSGKIVASNMFGKALTRLGVLGYEGGGRVAMRAEIRLRGAPVQAGLGLASAPKPEA